MGNEKTAPSESDIAPVIPIIEIDPLAQTEEDDRRPEANVSDRIKAFVRREHEHWKLAPKKWRKVKLPTESEAREIAKQAAKFSKSIGLTLRTKSDPDPTLLVYKVSQGVASANASVQSDVSAATEQPATTGE